MRESTGTDVLDWKVAGTGPAVCGREPNVSPIMRVTKEQVVGEESLILFPTATLKEIENSCLLHYKTHWADVTDVSEESVLEAAETFERSGPASWGV